MSLLEMMMRYTVCSTCQAFTYILSPTINTYLYGLAWLIRIILDKTEFDKLYTFLDKTCYMCQMQQSLLSILCSLYYLISISPYLHVPFIVFHCLYLGMVW
jgi:hypothetical protein